MTLETRLLGNGFAIEISGVDLGAPLDDATLGEIRDLWMRNKVVVFREQTIDDDTLAAFTERLGRLFVHVRDQFHAPDRPEIMYISNLKQEGRNLGALGSGDLRWHTDQSYAAAYAAMPADLRAEVDGQTAVYSISEAGTTKRLPLRPDQIERSPDQRHPLVRTHPHLGHKSLYLSPNHMTQIGDMSEADSRALIARLTAWAERPDFVYRHDWRVGDVVMWDNASVMHRRDAFPEAQRRFLKRTGFHLPEELGAPF
jgi:taurine dioxygenase